MLLLTSLPSEAVGTSDILALYRFRWQIELLFKRWKSLLDLEALDLEALPAHSPPLARCWLYAKLLAVWMIEAG